MIENYFWMVTDGEVLIMPYQKGFQRIPPKGKPLYNAECFLVERIYYCTFIYWWRKDKASLISTCLYSVLTSDLVAR